MKWKLEFDDGEVMFVDPEKSYIKMYGCTPTINPSTAKKIYDGANKTVCAKMRFEDIQITTPVVQLVAGTVLRFNPRVSPNWMLQEYSLGKYGAVVFNNANKLQFENVHTCGNMLVLPPSEADKHVTGRVIRAVRND